MKIGQKRWIRFRIYLVTFLFIIGFGIVWARAYQLQVLETDRLKKIARGGYIATIKLPPRRGTIYDREGHEMALSVQAASIYAHPKQVRDKIGTARALARTLNQKPSRISKLLESPQPFVWVERKVAPDLTGDLEDLKLNGVGVIMETRRYYPGKEIAAHLIGFDGIDNQGLEGLEKKYDSSLRGPPSTLVQMRDALGRPFSISKPNPTGRKMHDLILTIDKDIQYKAEQALKWGVNNAGAKAGHCLVVAPETGEILAMAVVPQFNPNIFNKYRPDQWRNRPVTDCFEPGSTLKAFLLAASLEESVVTPRTRFDCGSGQYRIGGHVVHDTHKHGVMNVKDIIVKSSNIGAIKIGETLGYSKFCEYLRGFGFGEKTGIDLLGERSGFVRSVDEAEPLDQASLFFGQGMSITSLQLAMATAAIANGGKLMRPYVVKKIRDSSGRVIKEIKPRMVRRVLSRKTAAETTRILEDVVSEEGTGGPAAIRGFRVAGKTGTAQKVDPKTGRYSEKRYVATFAGFVPADSPKIVIVVVIDEPQRAPYGGVVAGPVFSQVGTWSLNYLRVNPDLTRPEVTRASDFEDAVLIVGKRGTVEDKAKKPGDKGHTANVSKGAAEGFLPDFKGLGMREVLKRGRSLGIGVVLEGTGLAVKQEPGPGARLGKIQSVKVVFAPPT